MESSATISYGSLLLPKPPDPDFDMVFPMDSPVRPVPPEPPPVLRLKLTLYLRWGLSLKDLNPRSPTEPPDPPDRATPSQSKTFNIIIQQFFPHPELFLVDPKNLLILSVSHSSWAPSCDVVNFFVSTILKLRTLEIFVVSFELKRHPEDPCFQPPQTYFLSQLVVILVSDVGGNPLRRPALSYLFVNLAYDVGGNPHRCPALSHLFVNLMSDVCGNSFRHPVLSLLFVNLVFDVGGNPPPESSSEPSKASKVRLSAHNSHLLLYCGEYFTIMSPFYEWRKSLGFLFELSFSLLIGLLLCGAVCTGAEGAIEITPVFLVGGKACHL
ncbi:Uncharacterized protein Rs2_44860 [Raphanus sativus]|nr:Uncharacterized protein Rs2_44860 [Raphanus sativus]